jgi:hypothetical protein
MILFYLKLNRNGRRFLQPPMSMNIAAGLWPHILAKASDDASLLYFFLKNKADLERRKKKGLKRKASDKPALKP